MSVDPTDNPLTEIACSGCALTVDLWMGHSGQELCADCLGRRANILRREMFRRAWWALQAANAAAEVTA